jgi:XTP/dITP diphosphohydrolase
MRLVLASANIYKKNEVGPILEAAGYEVVLAGEMMPEWDVEEIGDSLTENARLKARAAVAATGEAAIADDTGLFVDALDGAPGVRSSRFAGPSASYADNVRKLLAMLEEVPAERRTARFRTVALMARPDGEEVAFEGVVEGRILEVPRGEHGFGYDPVFLIPAEGRSLAEMELAEKNRVSHRAQAFRLAAAFLTGRPEWLGSHEMALAEDGPKP